MRGSYASIMFQIHELQTKGEILRMVEKEVAPSCEASDNDTLFSLN